MKTIHFLIILIVIGFSDKVFAQEKSASDLIIGAWSFDYKASIDKMKSASKEHLDTLSVLKKQNIENNYKGRTVSFNAGGSYQQTLANGNKAEGTWTIDKNKSLVIITDPKGFKHKQLIKSISKTHLVLVPIMEGKSRMLVSQWNFIKSKNEKK